MILKQKACFIRILFLAAVVIAGSGFLPSGCALRSPNIIDPAAAGPRIAVNPDSIRLGVAALMGTNIIFEGAGFQPGDSVFISLVGPDNADGAVATKIVNPDGTVTITTMEGPVETEVIMADGKVRTDGTFTATVTNLTKVTGILRADMAIDTYSENAEYGQSVVITREPVPTGVYTARATGKLSNQKAETKFTIGGPSITDRLKDWIGKKMGKIQDKRS
jgi:hypothetical protein